jgi:hypothetical protein
MSEGKRERKKLKAIELARVNKSSLRDSLYKNTNTS